MAKTIQIDRRRHLADEPQTGHNRWHPDIAPAVEVDEGEEVVLEARDAMDGYLTPSTTVADFPSLPLGVIHPLTGPVLVKGARPVICWRSSSSTSLPSGGPSRPSCRASASCATS